MHYDLRTCGTHREFNHESVDDAADYRDEVESVPWVLEVALERRIESQDYDKSGARTTITKTMTT